MYGLFTEDINKLDSEFFKLDAVYDFTSIYTESEESSDKQQSVISKMCTAILNFIRSIRAKILKLFGNDDKANEILKKIDATKTVEVSVYDKEIKALEEESQELQNAVDKAVNDSLSDEDITKLKNKRKTVLGIVGAALGVGGATTAVAVKKKFKISDLIPFKNKKGTDINKIISGTERAIKKLETKLNKEQNKKNKDENKISKIETSLKILKENLNDLTKTANKQVQEINQVIAKEAKANHSDDEQPATTADKDESNGTPIQSETPEQKNDESETQPKNTNTQQSDQKNLTPEEQKEFDKYKDENDNIIKEISDQMKKNNVVNLAGGGDLHLKFMNIYKDYSDNKSSMTLDKNKEYNSQFKKIKNDVDTLIKNKPKTDSSQQAENQPKNKEENDEEQLTEEQQSCKRIALAALKQHSNVLSSDAPKFKKEIEEIINNGKYTRNDFKRLDEIVDILMYYKNTMNRVDSSKDKLNDEEKEKLERLSKKPLDTVTKNDYEELKELVYNVEVRKEQEKKNKTNTNNNNDKIIEPSYGKHKGPLHDMLTKPDQSKYVKPEEKQELEEIEDRIKNKKFTEKDGKYIEKLTMEIIHREEADDESNEKSNETNNNKSDSSEVSLAKEILNILITIRKMVSKTKSGTNELEKGETVSLGGKYAILLKEDDIKTINSIKSTDDDFVDKVKNVTASVLKSLKKDYGVGNIRNEFNSMGITLSIDAAKEKTDEINKARKELEEKYNELENSKTTNESSYDLINNILTVFENSF